MHVVRCRAPARNARKDGQRCDAFALIFVPAAFIVAGVPEAPPDLPPPSYEDQPKIGF